MAYVSLAPLVPAWDDRYIPEVYAAIEKGIRRLQARYWLWEYALVSYVVHFNEDRYTDTFRFELGVRGDPGAAARACDRLLRCRMLEAMVGVDSEEWTVEENDLSEGLELARFPPRIDVLAWETRGGAWDHVSVFVGVVTLSTAPVFPWTPIWGQSPERCQ